MPYGLRVGAHALLLGDHAREVLGLLVDAQRDGLSSRSWATGTGWYGEPFQHTPRLGAVVAAGDQLRADPRGRHVDDPADPLQQRARCRSAPSGRAAVRSIETTQVSRLVTSGRPMVVDDQAALRLHDDVAHRLGGGLALVLLPPTTWR